MQDKALHKRDLLLDSVGFAAERFLRASRWQDAIGEVLAGLGRAVEASRLHVYEVTGVSSDDPTCDLLSEWAAEGITPQIDNPLEHDFPLVSGGYERWVGVLGSGGVLAGRREEFPESERRFMADEHIKSVLVVPIFVDEEWWGWIGFDECVLDRDWSPVETDALRAAAGILGAAIQRERSDAARAQAERRYETLVEQIPAVTYIESYGLEYAGLLYISPQIESMLGFAPDMWMQDPFLWERQMHPDDRERVLATSEASNQGGTDYSSEYRMYSADGGLVWVRDQAVLVHDEPGSPLYWQGVMYDITEQRVSTEQIEAAESRYRHLVEQIPAITYVEELGRTGRLLYISPQLRNILGYDPEAWIVDPEAWLGAVVEADKPIATRSGGEDDPRDNVSLEYRMRADDGRTVWFRDSSVVINDSEGKPLFWQGVMYDITEQKIAHELLQEAEERYKALVEQIPAVTYIDDRTDSGRLSYVSPQIEHLTGHTADEFMADRNLWLELIHPDDRHRVSAEDDRVQGTGEPFNVDYRLIGNSGREFWIHDEAVVVSRSEEGNPVYWQGVMVDITERKRAEELELALEVEKETSQRLRDLDDMKNTFLTAVSHDLRTPLAAILGLAITLEREDIDLAAKESADLTRRIAANARKLDRLVSDLLDLDRLSRGILEPQRRPTDVGALVRKVVDEADFLGDHPVQVEADPVVLAVDGAKVERIVENLLANAVRHTAVGTQVWVIVNQEGDGVMISVEDAGPGVLEELRDAVFEPFRQGDEATHSPGVGIGLSLVARFAELHGGKAWVEERPGGGASFRVFLPGAAGETHFT